MQKTREYNSGFTLLEMLIIVNVIGILGAISIAILSRQLHKTGVAADWANVRMYYSELQVDYISIGEYNKKVPVDWSTNFEYDWYSITFLNKTKVQLKAGVCALSFEEGSGYSIVYNCTKGHAACELIIN